MLEEPSFKSFILVVLINRGEVCVLTHVSKRVEQATDEETLAYSIGQGLNQIPTEPINLIDAVVTDPELGGEKHGSQTEDCFVSTSSLQIQFRLDGLKLGDLFFKLDFLDVEAVDVLPDYGVIEELEGLPDDLSQLLLSNSARNPFVDLLHESRDGRCVHWRQALLGTLGEPGRRRHALVDVDGPGKALNILVDLNLELLIFTLNQFLDEEIIVGQTLAHELDLFDVTVLLEAQLLEFAEGRLSVHEEPGLAPLRQV